MTDVPFGELFGCATPSSTFSVDGVPFECRPWALVLGFTALFFALQAVATRWFFKTDSAGKPLSGADKLEAAIRFVALLHSLVTWVGIPDYFWPPAALQPQLDAAGVPVYNHYAYSPLSQLLYAWSTGYFLWDIVVSIRYQWGAMFIAHAFISFGVFFLALAPFLHLWGLYFQGIFELSTVFFHFRAILALLKRENTLLYTVVQACFVVLFLLVRIVFGFYSSWGLCREMLALAVSENVRNPVVPLYYAAADVLIMVLQVVWCAEFVKIAIGSKKEEGQMKKE